MKDIKILLVMILIQSISLALNANEKIIINNNTKTHNKYLSTLFSLNKANNKDNILSLSDNETNDNDLCKIYQIKAKKFLTMVYAGIVFISLFGTIFISSAICFSLFMGIIGLVILLAISILSAIVLLVPGVLLIVVGFNRHYKYKQIKVPNPFLEIDRNKKLDLGLSLK